MFVSFNDGANWRALKLNLPTTPVHDLVVKNDDLVLATHGRSFWILDDVSPLRQFTDQITVQDVHLYTPATAYRFHNPSDEERKSVIAGQNPPPGAVVYYYLKNAPKGETTIEILDSAGAVIRKYPSNRTEPVESLGIPTTRNQRNKSRRKPGLTVSSGTNVTREPAAYPDTTCSNTRRAPMAHSRCRANTKFA